MGAWRAWDRHATGGLASMTPRRIWGWVALAASLLLLLGGAALTRAYVAILEAFLT